MEGWSVEVARVNLSGVQGACTCVRCILCPGSNVYECECAERRVGRARRACKARGMCRVCVCDCVGQSLAGHVAEHPGVLAYPMLPLN